MRQHYDISEWKYRDWMRELADAYKSLYSIMGDSARIKRKIAILKAREIPRKEGVVYGSKNIG